MDGIPSREIIGTGRNIMARGGMNAPPYFPKVPDNIRENPEQVQSWYLEIAQNPSKDIPADIKKNNPKYAKKLAGKFKQYASLKAGREWTGRKQDGVQTDNAADVINQETIKMQPWVQTIDTVAGMVTFDAHKNLIKAGEYVYEGQYANAIFETLKAGGKIAGSTLLIAATGGAGKTAQQPIINIGNKLFKAVGGGKSKVLKYIGDVGKQFEKVVEKGKTFFKPKGSKLKDAYGGMSREKYMQQLKQHMQPKSTAPATPKTTAPTAPKVPRSPQKIKETLHSFKEKVYDPGGIGGPLWYEPGQMLNVVR